MSLYKIDNTTAEILVEFKKASFKAGGETVFPETELAIRKGECWGIIGPNGSGKSLFIQAIIGEIYPVCGDVVHNLRTHGGEECDPADAIALISAQTQRLFIRKESSFYQARWHSGIEEGKHTVSEFLSQNVVENINPFAVDSTISSPYEFNNLREQLCDKLNIAHLLKRKIIHLSNGEQRRVLLAHLLLKKPQILILDDPFAGLDLDSRKRLSRLLIELKKNGLTIILVSHRAEEISRFLTNIALIRDYKIIMHGKKSQVIRKISETTNQCSLLGKIKNLKSIVTRTTLSFKTVLKVENLTVHANDKIILQNLNWTVFKGEHWAILGPNGSGKTTLLNVIRGDHPQVYAQNILLFDKLLDSPDDFVNARKKIGSFSLELHQHFPLESSCLDAVCSGFDNTLGLFKRLNSQQKKRALALLEDFGMADVAWSPLGELSTANQRLVLICRAMVRTPWLLILDEPCQGLDTLQKLTVLKAIDRIVEQTDAHLLFVTHHPKEMPSCITNILKFKHGKYSLCKRR
ncbi:MAG: ATP-binding cassette domain-containing protein [Verrucomicrobiae bacterium]|nr:ATP-binding cassette domain-containing protein [Verrucomicrobiae bacterium]